ncbi:hypothetical protein BD779DRAFT_1802138 [Infundibulicybe gibba]|nr:hypothetical protein BD779DRAFT_1802138 [Infundibulicybe gibba]
MSSPSVNGIDISGPFAPIYWGTFCHVAPLGGMTIVQAYIISRTRETARPFGSWRDACCRNPVHQPGSLTQSFHSFFDLVSSALVAQSIYYYLVPHFGSLEPLTSVTPELSAECLLSTIITFMSQMYFVYQLYSVRRLDLGRWFVVGTITAFAILAFVGGVACVATMYVFKRGVLSDRNHTFAIFFGLAKGFGALTDVLATIAMCMTLASSKTGMKGTTTLLNSLIQFIIHRGALVTLIQTLLLLTFFAAPTQLYWFAFHINVTKLYANTFFAMLNARSHLQHDTVVAAQTKSWSNRTQERLDTYTHQTNVELQDIDDHKSYAMPTVTTTVVISDL